MSDTSWFGGGGVDLSGMSGNTDFAQPVDPNSFTGQMQSNQANNALGQDAQFVQNNAAPSPGLWGSLGNAASSVGKWITGGSPGGLSGMTGSLGGLLKGISPFVSAGAGIANVANGPGTIPYKSQQQNNASTASNAAQPLINAATTGQLPAGEETMIEQQVQAQIQQIKAKYAAMGLTGSTMEQQDLQAAQQSGAALKANMISSAISQGQQLLGTSSSAYNNLATQQVSQDKNYQDALAALSAAFGGNPAAKPTTTATPAS